MGKTTILFLGLILKCIAATPQVSGYSFTSSNGSYQAIAGTSPLLTGDGINALQDEGFANRIPIGFSFNYLGINYDSIGVSTNGFAAFGNLTQASFSNNLSNGGSGRPLLAPLWDDLSLAGISDIQYLTTGSVGTRVFTLQWSHVNFDFAASDTALSFQLRLYETSNIIEFVYYNLPGPVHNFSGGASIGITGKETGISTFISLKNTGANPEISSLVAFDTLSQKPASGQIYRFTPPICSVPPINIISINSNLVSINWADSVGAGSYEYSISLDKIPPVAGLVTSNTSHNDATLLPSTQYYFHLRRGCGAEFSQWTSISFVTACDSAVIPYVMPINSANAPQLPACVIAEDVNNDGYTWRSYSSGGRGWTDQVLAYVFNINTTTPANDWLFTRAIALNAGKSYRLKFKYGNDGSPQFAEKLRVAYGSSANASAMTTTILDLPQVNSNAPQTASVDFIPAGSGNYWIGFLAYSDANKNVLILDDIRIDTTPACDIPRNLRVALTDSGRIANFNWSLPAIGVPGSYEYAVTTNGLAPDSGTVTNVRNGTAAGLTPGANYYLHVRSNCSGIKSDWAMLPFNTIINDLACNAMTLVAGGAAICGNNSLATSGNEPYLDCSDPDHTLWYKFTPAITGAYVLQISIPPAPANPLRGWVNWYSGWTNCEIFSLQAVGDCSEFGKLGNGDITYIVSPLLNAGTTYYLMIDGLSNDTGEFCLQIPACSPVLDGKVSSILSMSALINWTGTGNFTLEYGPPGFTPGVGIDAGTGGTVINGISAPYLLNGLTLSTAYDVYLRKDCSSYGDGFSANSDTLKFTTLGVPPGNDECAGAISLPVHNLECTTPVEGSTTNATPSSVVPLPTCSSSVAGYDDDVWYKFTPSTDQNLVNIVFTQLAGSALRDMIAQVYTTSDNSCSGEFIPYVCSDDEGPETLPGFYNLSVVPGKTYYIRLYTYTTGVFGDYTICVYKTLLNNDEAPGAFPIIIDQPCAGDYYTNVGATVAPDEPALSASSDTAFSTVWFKFTAPSGGGVRISTAVGTGNTLANTRITLYQASDVFNYSTFNVIGSDEDGGSGSFDKMSVLFATGLSSGATYHIQVDRFNDTIPEGSFCITVERITPAMLASGNCNTVYQQPVGSRPDYKGWVSLLDENSRLVAMVRNTAGGRADAYSGIVNVHGGAVRKDEVSNEYYLNRSFRIINPAVDTSQVQVQFFFPTSELNSLLALDSAATLTRLRATRQTSSICYPEFISTNGINTEIPQNSTGSGSISGVSWFRANVTGLSNFYIHATKSLLTARVFLQGAWSSTLGRNKDVTSQWSAILNSQALTQPYNTAPFTYTGKERLPAGFFNATDGSTDILDWILLEVKSSGGSTISRRAALLREDGSVVDLDGYSPVSMYGVANGNFNLFIRHRNHLGVRTSNLQSFTAIALGISPPVTGYNFTTAQSQAYQNAMITSNPAMAEEANYYMLWAGNANIDEYTRFVSQGLPPIPSDAAFVLGTILSGNHVSTVTGYSVGDLNLDGKVRAVSQGFPPIPSDNSFILGSVLGGTPGSGKREHK